MTRTIQQAHATLDAAASKPSRRRAFMIVAAFAAIYVIWGSTYLAIRVAVETLPPFSVAGIRFLIAGAVLYGVAALRGGARPGAAEWRSAVIAGGLLLLGGNGAVMWASTFAPSGFVALIVATVPMWMVVLPLLRGVRPRVSEGIGVAIGLAGVFWLLDPFAATRPDAARGTAGALFWGGLLVTVGSMLWAGGSLYARRATLPRDPLVSTALQMLTGGAWLTIVGAAVGEFRDLDLRRASGESLIAFAYLLVFGSLIAFTAYVWLLRVTSPAKVATYAYVNPAVAVLLGWAILKEPITPRMLVAMLLILASVVMITAARSAATIKTPAGERRETCEG